MELAADDEGDPEERELSEIFLPDLCRAHEGVGKEGEQVDEDTEVEEHGEVLGDLVVLLVADGDAWFGRGREDFHACDRGKTVAKSP